MFLTGCRPGEAIALTWEDVDWGNGQIFINKAAKRDLASSSYATKKIVGQTKTGSTGYIPFQGRLKELVEELPHREGLLFPGHKGGIMDIRRFRGIWAQVLRCKA
jgi:integrase